MSNNFKRGAIILGIAAALGWPWSFLFSVRSPSSIPAIFSAVTLSLGVAFYLLLIKCEAWLANRISANSSARWRIEINGVEVGEITDSQYGVMLRDSLRDGSFMVACIKSLMTSILRSCCLFVMAVPILAFWLLYATAMQSSADFLGYMHEVGAMDSASLTAALQTLMQLCFLAGMPILFTLAVCWTARNNAQCNRAIADRLRRHYGVTATGIVCLYKDWSWHGRVPIRQ
ncbi:hypothetical protein [Achromobacter aegrifaciens]|uniref:Uncharacterized protein n=1 Tax=Achromobacter aegrifaciens TaxID=1287736 RepID=A0ABU2DJI1_ACHAE|nr:hypothetical protein [Achromobacter aegrifaciens]MDR7948282.1 hypothetical protein [Achromobacter aegrifaciens]